MHRTLSAVRQPVASGDAMATACQDAKCCELLLQANPAVFGFYTTSMVNGGSAFRSLGNQ
jgi:hypothetical protein